MKRGTKQRAQRAARPPESSRIDDLDPACTVGADVFEASDLVTHLGDDERVQLVVDLQQGRPVDTERLLALQDKIARVVASSRADATVTAYRSDLNDFR